MSNPYTKILKPLKRKHRFKMKRKINKQTYNVWTPPGSGIVMPCSRARSEAIRLRKIGYSVRVQKRKNGCQLLIRRKK